jgi:hypothetical protein
MRRLLWHFTQLSLQNVSKTFSDIFSPKSVKKVMWKLKWKGFFHENFLENSKPETCRHSALNTGVQAVSSVWRNVTGTDCTVLSVLVQYPGISAASSFKGGWAQSLFFIIQSLRERRFRWSNLEISRAVCWIVWSAMNYVVWIENICNTSTENRTISKKETFLRSLSQFLTRYFVYCK